MPLQDWEITVLLADSAQVSEGKLHILGGGWQALRPTPTLPPTALAVLVKVPWPETNRKHKLEITLFDADGKKVMAGDKPIAAMSEFELGRPAGFAPGTRLNVPMAIGIGPLALPPGRYEWAWTLDGEARDDWKVQFEVMG